MNYSQCFRYKPVNEDEFAEEIKEENKRQAGLSKSKDNELILENSFTPENMNTTQL